MLPQCEYGHYFFAKRIISGGAVFVIIYFHAGQGTHVCVMGEDKKKAGHRGCQPLMLGR